MGGFGSGRSGGRATVEDGLTLNLSKLLRDGLFQPGQSRGGSIVWTVIGSGEHVSWIRYQAFLGQEKGRVRLQYTTTRWNGETHISDYWIELATTPQPFGGYRWWFVCPKLGGLVAKLHLPPGGLTFASRRAYRLAYRSQREVPRDRVLRRAFKLRNRLGDNGGIGSYILKPKRMRYVTFDRRMAEVAAAEAIVDAHSRLLLRRLGA